MVIDEISVWRNTFYYRKKKEKRRYKLMKPGVKDKSLYYTYNRERHWKTCFRGLLVTKPRDYKTFFMLNSIEHENFPAHKC